MRSLTITFSSDLEKQIDIYLRDHPDCGGASELIVNALRAYLREDLRPSDVINPDRPLRYLEITPAEPGSGRSDVSIRHDEYLAEFTAERKLPE